MKKGWHIACSLLLAVSVGLAGCADGGGSNGGNRSDGEAYPETRNSTSSPQEESTAGSEDRAPGGGESTSETSEPAAGGDDREPAEEDQSRNPEPQAGMLTAGEWQDTIRWASWRAQLNEGDGGKYQRKWSFYRFDRLVLKVTGDGEPVSDAYVAVKDDQGELVWEARTDIFGRAYAFAGLFRSKPASDGYYVEVVGDGGRKRYDNVKFPRSEPLEIDLGRAASTSDRVDVLFAIDTTGSMQDELDYLETELTDVIERVRNAGQEELDLRIGTDFYRDVHDEYTVRTFPFTPDVGLAVERIAAQQAKGGKDYPEAVDEALEAALDEERWSENARARLLFLVLDAPPHDDKETVRRMNDLVRRAAALGVRIVPVASSGVDASTEYLMRFLAVATGGTYVFLTDHSGIGKDHKEAEVGEYEVRALNDLLVEVIRRYTVTDGGTQEQEQEEGASE